MKLIFLDIDGVLNSQIYFENKKDEDLNVNVPGRCIDQKAVSFLNDLIAKTDAKVVISSTWRRSGLEYCKTHLEAKGFKGEIIDITPMSSFFRGEEIYEWIHKNIPDPHDFSSYVIFDDDSDMLLWQQYNFIKVDPYAGLSPNNCYKAHKILTGKYP